MNSAKEADSSGVSRDWQAVRNVMVRKIRIKIQVLGLSFICQNRKAGGDSSCYSMNKIYHGL